MPKRNKEERLENYQKNILEENKEIAALLSLIDDPDEDIYQSVSDRLFSFGKDIIPNLEHKWESIQNEIAQERIELLIHRLHFDELTSEYKNWLNKKGGLLEAAILVAKYHYPDIDSTEVVQAVEKIRKNIWLELNNYLTPMEQINVFNSILFNYYKHKGVEMNFESPDQFLINKTLQNKKGNAISYGILYLILCEMVDIPVYAVQIPKQFILAFFNENLLDMAIQKKPLRAINFFIDPFSGQMYSANDVENYFKKTKQAPSQDYFKPMNNQEVIRYLLVQLSKCFKNENNHYKMEELLFLSKLTR